MHCRISKQASGHLPVLSVPVAMTVRGWKVLFLPPTSHWLLVWFTLPHWSWRQYVPSKRWWTSTRLHGVTSQKLKFFSNLVRTVLDQLWEAGSDCDNTASCLFSCVLIELHDDFSEASLFLYVWFQSCMMKLLSGAMLYARYFWPYLTPIYVCWGTF
jgi:hypothetical protein